MRKYYSIEELMDEYGLDESAARYALYLMIEERMELEEAIASVS